MDSNYQKLLKIGKIVNQEGYYLEYPSDRGDNLGDFVTLSLDHPVKLRSLDSIIYEVVDFAIPRGWMALLEPGLPQIKSEGVTRTSDWRGGGREPYYAEGTQQLLLWYKPYSPDSSLGFGVDLSQDQEIIFVRWADKVKYYYPVPDTTVTPDAYMQYCDDKWELCAQVQDPDTISYLSDIFQYHNTIDYHVHCKKLSGIIPLFS